MVESKGLRSSIGTLIFFCVGAYFCYLTYFDFALVFLVHFDHSKNYDLVLWGPRDWLIFTMIVATVLTALIQKWWSTLPLWLLALIVLVAQIHVEQDRSLYANHFARILVVPVAIQVAALLRKPKRQE